VLSTEQIGSSAKISDIFLDVLDFNVGRETQNPEVVPGSPQTFQDSILYQATPDFFLGFSNSLFAIIQLFDANDIFV
jgi:hypothetical protein